MLGRSDIAAKTGTTNEYRDAWFVGYSPGLLTGVWVGHDDMSPLGEKETGARAAGPIWVDFMKEALSRYQEAPFEPPEGIETFIVDLETGLIVNTISEELDDIVEDLPENFYVEYFRAGTEPPYDSEIILPTETEQNLDEEPPFRVFN